MASTRFSNGHFPDMFSLADRVAIVTGASRGLGRSIAIGLAEAGADVVIADMLSGESVTREIERLGRRSVAMKVDVSKSDEVNRMASETVTQFGHIDILVNNAGIGARVPADKLSKREWDKVMAINLTSVFLCSQAVGRFMIKQKKGRIINMTSIYGLRATHTKGFAYGVSKGGIVNLTRELAIEWAKYNININALAPSFFNTEICRPLLEDKDFYENVILARTPLRRVGQPDELKGAVIFLASEASNMVTGHILNVDGGWCAW